MSNIIEQTGSPFHDGERTIQSRAQVPASVEAIGRQIIRDHMPEQHRDFFAELPCVLLGAVDDGGQPWATMLTGAPGFLHSPDPQHLIINAIPSARDPIHPCIKDNAMVGLLGIQPHTRRRNRLNGRITRRTDDLLEVTVVQSFGNCPKYIQAREARFVESYRRATALIQSDQLDASTRAIITAADTFFIASTHPAQGHSDVRAEGVDVSHRGGRPGFVLVENARTLVIPDFAGNRLFNTLGNLQLEPRAGLLFVDFVNGDMLFLAVTAEILWDGPLLTQFSGAERLVRFRIRQVRYIQQQLNLRWGDALLSPHLNSTGAW